jgi:hypothetical protein
MKNTVANRNNTAFEAPALTIWTGVSIRALGVHDQKGE